MPKKPNKRQSKSKSSALTKGSPKNVEKKLTSAEVRERLLCLYMPFDPETWREKDLEKILNQLGEKPGKEATTAVVALGFDNDYVLVHTVSEWYHGLVIELRRKLIKDFNCKTHAEKALVDMVVSGYMRVVRASQAFTVVVDKGHTTPGLNQHMSIMSKEIDRAHRHFTTSYQMLVQLKQPPINVHLKTKNAFVAQAQQFNMDKPETEGDEEIVNPK